MSCKYLFCKECEKIFVAPDSINNKDLVCAFQKCEFREVSLDEANRIVEKQDEDRNKVYLN